MSGMKKFLTGIRAARYLGFENIGLYAFYQIGLKTGWQKFSTNLALRAINQYPDDQWIDIAKTREKFFFSMLDADTVTKLPGFELSELINEADEILRGNYRQFGGEPVPIKLDPQTTTNWAVTDDNLKDMKFIWEPARFGWVFTLGRAYHYTKNEDYPKIFWQYFNEFQKHNPPYQGPNWASGQEAGLRILAFSFAWQIFKSSKHSTTQHTTDLAKSIAINAARIPSSLIYARAQNNNHLLTEAAGLYTASSLLPELEQAAKWKKSGWKWLNYGFQKQINSNGEYSQHSNNYHRLMLHTSLWVAAVAKFNLEDFPENTLGKLAAASEWLAAQLDAESGSVPNLGSNDGARILPLSQTTFEDYRPICQASMRAFKQQTILSSGKWDENLLWLGIPISNQPDKPIQSRSDAVNKLGSPKSWATLRAVHYDSRPFQADQLHVELWHLGHNIALDSGTYRYTAPHPWDNSLSGSTTHNTILVNNNDQMARAGRFLWLDWAQAEVIEKDDHHITARHYGYEKFGLIHQRELRINDEKSWIIKDSLLPTGNPDAFYDIHLHWLLPNFKWEFENNTLKLFSENQNILINIESGPEQNANLSFYLYREGKSILNNGKDNPILGWYSSTYAHKSPALSLLVSTHNSIPLTLHTCFTFL